MIDDTIPHPQPCCGRTPDVRYGPTSVIYCVRCGEKTIVDTAPFFRDGARQREHEIWRAVEKWNEKHEAIRAG